MRVGLEFSHTRIRRYPDPLIDFVAAVCAVCKGGLLLLVAALSDLIDSARVDRVA